MMPLQSASLTSTALTATPGNTSKATVPRQRQPAPANPPAHPKRDRPGLEPKHARHQDGGAAWTSPPPAVTALPRRLHRHQHPHPHRHAKLLDGLAASTKPQRPQLPKRTLPLPHQHPQPQQHRRHQHQLHRADIQAGLAAVWMAMNRRLKLIIRLSLRSRLRPRRHVRLKVSLD